MLGKAIVKAHKVELLILDFDEVGAETIKELMENVKYPNHCIQPDVKDIKTVDIGGWSDDHLLNKKATAQNEYERIFN